MRQLRRMVAIIMIEKRAWTCMWMATLRTGLKGDKKPIAFVAENRKMSFPWK